MFEPGIKYVTLDIAQARLDRLHHSALQAMTRYLRRWLHCQKSGVLSKDTVQLIQLGDYHRLADGIKTVKALWHV